MTTRHQKRSVRMGPISVFVLVVILCLSVMAVLSATTANASVNEANKQADVTIGTYANEIKAQEFVASIDATLARTQASGGGIDAALSAVKNELPAAATLDGNKVSVAFVATDGRMLTVRIVIQENLTYQITEWKVTTRWNSEETQSAGTLWGGN